MLLLQPARALAEEVACKGTGATVSGWSRQEAEEICDSIRRAMDFLRSNDLQLAKGLVVRRLDIKALSDDPHSIARFNGRTNEIHVLPFDEAVTWCRKEAQSFSVPMTRDLWRSNIAHETAHAAAEPHFTPGVSKAAASEYIATVTQLSTLPETTRRTILDNYRDFTAWGDESEISMTFYLLDPCAFAVKSYLHFYGLPLPHRPRLIERLLRQGLRD
jgi:hypothetical protein